MYRHFRRGAIGCLKAIGRDTSMKLTGIATWTLFVLCCRQYMGNLRRCEDKVAVVVSPALFSLSVESH